MVENPYFHRTPIRDQRFFFGRTRETQKVLEYVVDGRPVSIVGPRRIGKTSLLFHLCDSRVKANHGVGDDYVFAYVTCEILSGAPNKCDVYRVLLRRAIEAMPGNHSTGHSSQEPTSYLDFEEWLYKLIAPDRKIVFLLDEFEAMAGNHQLGKDFFDELRALGQTDKVIYITASGETLFNLSFHDETALNSPFFNIFSPVPLGWMEWHEARDLVTGTAAIAGFEGFDENDHAFLQEIAGPHPFYLQVACYHLFEEKTKGGGSTAPGYDSVKRRFAEELQPHFQYTWKHLSDDERRALKLIREENLDRVAAEDVERLEQKCLVCQGKIFSSVFAEFVISEIERAARLTSGETVEVTTETGKKRQVKITKPPLVITDEDLRRFGMH
jgi:hypothetical protein